jgi:predicted nicotinamide N-methyase
MSMSTTVDVVPGRSLSIATNEDLATLGGEAGVLAVASSAMLAEDLSRSQRSARDRAPGVEAAELGTWTGGTIWESATYLATFLAEQHELCWPELSVVDLGCGCGIVGLVAAALQARRVVLTDQVLHVAQHNADLNFTSGERDRIELRELRWGDGPSLTSVLEANGGEGYAVIVASDVIYATGVHAALAETIAALSKDDTVVLLCTPDGSASDSEALEQSASHLAVHDEAQGDEGAQQQHAQGRPFFAHMRRLGFWCEDITPA